MPSTHQGTAGTLLTTYQHLSGALTLAVLTLALGPSPDNARVRIAFLIITVAAVAGLVSHRRAASPSGSPSAGRRRSAAHRRAAQGRLIAGMVSVATSTEERDKPGRLAGLVCRLLTSSAPAAGHRLRETTRASYRVAIDNNFIKPALGGRFIEHHTPRPGAPERALN
jgi:hypothetical protein